MPAVAPSTAAVEDVGVGPPRLAVGLGLELVLELELVHDAVRVVDCWLLGILSAKSNKPLLYQANNHT